MEPPLGTLSFMILAYQLATECFYEMGVTPYHAMLRKRRASRLAALYPQYNARVCARGRCAVQKCRLSTSPLISYAAPADKFSRGFAQVLSDFAEHDTFVNTDHRDLSKTAAAASTV